MLHAALAIGVGEHVAAVLVEVEQHGVGVEHQGLTSELVFGVDELEAAVEEIARYGGLGGGEVGEQAREADVTFGFGGVEAGEREEDVALESDALLKREGETWGVAGGGFGDVGLGAEGQLDLGFGAVIALGKGGIMERVEDVVAGVAFMAGKLDGSVDGDGEVEIEQDGAVGVAFVAAEGTPGLVAGEGEPGGRRMNLRVWARQPASAACMTAASLAGGMRKRWSYAA